MPVALYHTPRCPYAELISLVAVRLTVPLERTEVSQTDLAKLPWGNYERSPVLIDRESVLEDWRAIVRYLDEQYGGGVLAALPPQRRAELFNLCEQVDKQLLAPAALLLANQPKNIIQQCLNLLPIHKVRSSAVTNGLPALRADLATLRTTLALPSSEFPLLHDLLQAAQNSLR